MLLFASIMALIALSIGPVWPTVLVGGQCGGVFYTGDRACETGTICIYVDMWQSQCRPLTHYEYYVAQLYEQCEDTNPYVKCAAGLTCEYGAAYSRCINASATTAAPTTTTTTSTTTTTTTTKVTVTPITG